MASVEERNREFRVVWVVTIAFCYGPRGRTQLQAEIPEFLGEAANRILESLLGLAIGKKKEQVDVGIGKKPAAAESTSGDEGKIRGLRFVGRDDVMPESS